MNSDTFYRDFEDLHRGSRELITSRLRVYLPFVTPLLDVYQDANALDLGCGRGEWLELISGCGFDATGVDLDQGMLAACVERGLKARQANGIQVLREMPSASVALISAFHVIEHIAFDDLRVVMTEALRVLKPGGLLILETPNSENLSVGTSTFYLDPSHTRPIPAPLLQFLAKHAGFQRPKIVRLQEAATLHSSPETTLFEVLSGVSPDYGIVAQKAGEADILAKFNLPFNASYGVTLPDLSQRYDAHIAQLHAQLEAKTVELRAQFEAKITEVQTQFETQIDELQATVDRAYKKKFQVFIEHHYPTLMSYARAVRAMYRRNAGRLISRFPPNGVFNRTRRAWLARESTAQFAKLVITHGILFINARPYLKRPARLIARCFPAVAKRLQMPQTTPHSQNAKVFTDLSPRAQSIYTLITKIKKSDGK
jgi:SAM-dependent methyltransferase